MHYTKKGDQGTTKLFTSPQGVRIPKSAHVFEALGSLDEVNSYLGWCKASSVKLLRVGQVSAHDILHDVQNNIFTIQAEVAGADMRLPESSTESLEKVIGEAEAMLPPLVSFFVPGASELSARFDIARTVARRAERSLVALHDVSLSVGASGISDQSRSYMNRLSSLLFSLARLENERVGASESAPEYKK
jgi:cob(I)alamin adenosyltransferase